jgi:hypothetical protein
LTLGYCNIKEDSDLLLVYDLGYPPYEVPHQFTENFGWGEYEPMAV